MDADRRPRGGSEEGVTELCAAVSSSGGRGEQRRHHSMLNPKLMEMSFSFDDGNQKAGSSVLTV